MHNRYDVVIVGGGVIGSACAYFLATNDDFTGTVAVIERDPTYENAPSARATGGVRQQFSTPENICIGLYGAQFVKQADEHLGVDGEGTGVIFREQGYLLLATEQAMPVLAANRSVQTAQGADIVTLDVPALAARFPWLVTDGLVGANFGVSGEGWVDPYTLLQAFKRKARSLGVVYLHDTVTGIALDGGRATGVHTATEGELAAGVVLNAAGASGARALMVPLGINLPIESRLRTTFVWECKADMSGAPLTVLPSGVAWRPEGNRCIGSVAPPAEQDPERFDHDIDYSIFEEVIWPELARWVAPFDALKLSHAWSCHYDFNTLDENAIIDRAPGFDNVFMAAGFSGHGFQQSPAVGRALMELIVYGKYQTLDLTRLGFERIQRGEGIYESNCW